MMTATKIVDTADQCAWTRAIGRLAACAATALVALVPGLAYASSVPAPEYANVVQAYQPPPPACDIFCTRSTIDFVSITSRTGGISISALSDPFGDSYAAATDNNYTIPSVSASARATGLVGAGALSTLKYYIEFSSAANISFSMHVSGHEQATAAADDGAGPPDATSAGATATVSIYNNATQISLMFEQTNSGLLSHVGTQTLSFDDLLTFRTNTLYFATLNADVGAQFDHSAEAFADPYFDLSDLPDGVTFLHSDGIGNALPNASTPIPATLPLFGSGLGMLGLLGWRRKRKGSPTPSESSGQ